MSDDEKRERKVSVNTVLSLGNGLSEKILELGGSPDSVRQLCEDKRALSWLASHYMQSIPPPPSSAPRLFAVDFDPRLTVAEYLERGGYDEVNPLITVERFPLACREAGQTKLAVVPIEPHRSAGQVRQELSLLRFQPADTILALAFGLRWPEEQRVREILALDACWTDEDGTKYYLCLGQSKGKRVIEPRTVSEWNAYCAFLAEPTS